MQLNPKYFPTTDIATATATTTATTTATASATATAIAIATATARLGFFPKFKIFPNPTLPRKSYYPWSETQKKNCHPSSLAPPRKKKNSLGEYSLGKIMNL